MIVQFIDGLRPHYQVESICAVLIEQAVKVAPADVTQLEEAATISAHPHRCGSHRRAARHSRDAGRDVRTSEDDQASAQAEHQVAHCTVDRLMRDEGMCGVICGKGHRTTAPSV